MRLHAPSVIAPSARARRRRQRRPRQTKLTSRGSFRLFPIAIAFPRQGIELVKQHLDWITLRRGDRHALPRPAISAVEQLPACRDAGSQALREWLDAAGIEVGALFRPIDKAGTVQGPRLTCRSVANIVKAYAGRAGFDASTFSGHSLRAGFLTSAAGKGASIFKMMDVSRHKSVDTLRGYVRDAELFKDHAGTGFL